MGISTGRVRSIFLLWQHPGNCLFNWWTSRLVSLVVISFVSNAHAENDTKLFISENHPHSTWDVIHNHLIGHLHLMWLVWQVCFHACSRRIATVIIQLMVVHAWLFPWIGHHCPICSWFIGKELPQLSEECSEMNSQLQASDNHLVLCRSCAWLQIPPFVCC